MSIWFTIGSFITTKYQSLSLSSDKNGFQKNWGKKIESKSRREEKIEEKKNRGLQMNMISVFHAFFV